MEEISFILTVIEFVWKGTPYHSNMHLLIKVVDLLIAAFSSKLALLD